MNNKEQMEQAVRLFLDRFQPESNAEFAVLGDIHAGFSAGSPLEDQLNNFIAIGDEGFLRDLYYAAPNARAAIVGRHNCPEDVFEQALRDGNTSVVNAALDNPVLPDHLRERAASLNQSDLRNRTGKEHPLLALDRNISLDLQGLSDYEQMLPAGEISGREKIECEKRIFNLQRLFDLVPSVLHQTNLSDNTDPLFYDLLTAKQHLSLNQRAFSRLRIALNNRFSKSDKEKNDEDPERSLMDETSRDDHYPEEEPAEEIEEGPTEEELEEERLAAIQREKEEKTKAEAEAKAAKQKEIFRRQQRRRKEAREKEIQARQEQLQQEHLRQQDEANYARTAVAAQATAEMSSQQLRQEQEYHAQMEDQYRKETLLQDNKNAAEREAQYEQKTHGYYSDSSKEDRREQEPFTRTQQPTEDRSSQDPYPQQQKPFAQYESHEYTRVDTSGKVYPVNSIIPDNQPKDVQASSVYPVQEASSQQPSFELIKPASAPDYSTPFYDERSYVTSKHKLYDEADRLEQRQRDKAEQKAHREETLQTYQTRQEQSAKYESFGKGHIDFSGDGKHGRTDIYDNGPSSSGAPFYDPSLNPPTQKKEPEPFRPYFFTASGIAPFGAEPASPGSDHPNSSQSSAEIYQAAVNSGTITKEMTRTLRDNFNRAREEYLSAQGTEHAQAAKKNYYEARDAVYSVIKDIQAEKLSFASGESTPTRSGGINAASRQGVNNGFTVYSMTPTGSQGASFENGQATGNVIVHNKPGSVGKDVLSRENPMVVSKAYEESLARSAVQAKAEMQQLLAARDSNGNSIKVSSSDFARLKLAVDAHNGFQQAKADGLVTVGTGSGAIDTPDQKAWAARRETFLNTQAYRNSRNDRFDTRDRRDERTGGGPGPRNGFDPRNQNDPRNRQDDHNRRRNNNDDWRRNNNDDRRRENQDDWNRRRGNNDDRRRNNNDDRRRENQDDWNRRRDNNDDRHRNNNDDRRRENNNDRRRDRQNDPNGHDSGPVPYNLFNWTHRIAPFGSVFSIHYHRGKYSTGEHEVSPDLLNRSTKLRQVGAFRTMGSVVYGRLSLYAPEAATAALRKFYTMTQASGDSASQSVRTFEQGRYYATVGVGLASAYLHRDVGNVDRFVKSAARAERGEFGFTRELSTKEINKNLHKGINEGRAMKKEIRGLYEREAGLSIQERKLLDKKLKEHKAAQKETAKWAKLQQARRQEKIQKEVLQELHRKQDGHGLITENALNKIKAEQKQIQAQRRAILNSQPERSALNKRIAELQAKGKGNLTPEELAELHSSKQKLSKLSSDPRLKELDRKEQALRKALKKTPEETGAEFKHIRLKDANALRAKYIQEHSAVENAKFKDFVGIKNKDIKKNLNILRRQSEEAKVRLNALLKKGHRTGAEEAEIQMLLAKLKSNQNSIKRHATILKLRENRDMKVKAIDDVRKRLFKNKQKKRMGKMAFVNFLMKPLREGDQSGTQGLAKAIGYGTNPYVHKVIRGSLSITYQFNAFVLKKVGKLTGLDTKLEPVITKAKEVGTYVKKVANTPSELKKRTIKTASDAAKRAADRMTPKFIKTGVAGAKAGFARVGQYLVGTPVGKAYGAVLKAVHIVKAVAGTALKAAGAALGKVALILLAFLLVVALVSVIFESIGGSVPSFAIMSPDVDEATKKIDLSKYVAVYNEKLYEFQDKIEAAKSAKEYDNVTEERIGPWNLNNAKEIFSMMAVRLQQSLDMSENPDVREYIESLFDDSHTIETEESEPYSCSGCETRTELVDHNVNCPEDCQFTHEVDVPYCPGDHVDLNVIITTYVFDEIFYRDSMGMGDLGSGDPGSAIGEFTITHYCACSICCGKSPGDPGYGITASGEPVKENHTIAVDPDVIPLGSKVIINGKEYVAEDTGGAINGNRIDIYVSDHNAALNAGKYTTTVYWPVAEGGDYQETGEWEGWTKETIDWAKLIHSTDWNELYAGMGGIAMSFPSTSNMGNVNFIDGNRTGSTGIVDWALAQQGYTGGDEFWSWYGFDSHVPWCATFVSWCAYQSGNLDLVGGKHAYTPTWVNTFQSMGQWAVKGDTTPVAGDIVFFDWQQDGVVDHVGIVVGSDGTNVYTVEGNTGGGYGSVSQNTYSINSSAIVGYGLPNYSDSTAKAA